jgi:hypothetical protein
LDRVGYAIQNPRRGRRKGDFISGLQGSAVKASADSYVSFTEKPLRSKESDRIVANFVRITLLDLQSDFIPSFRICGCSRKLDFSHGSDLHIIQQDRRTGGQSVCLRNKHCQAIFRDEGAC